MSTASDRTAQLKYQCLAANNWSLYPAKKDVDMGCKSITNLLSETFCDGTYVGPGASFDISSNHHIVLKTTDRISFSAGGVSNVLDISSGGIKPTQILDTTDSNGGTSSYLTKNGASNLTWIPIPPSEGGWYGFATTELDMNGFKITDNTGALTLEATGGVLIESPTPSLKFSETTTPSAAGIELNAGELSTYIVGGDSVLTQTAGTIIVNVSNTIGDGSVSVANQSVSLAVTDYSTSATSQMDISPISVSIQTNSADTTISATVNGGSASINLTDTAGVGSLALNIGDGGGGSSVVEFGVGSIAIKSDFGVGAPVLSLFDTGSSNGGTIEYGINTLSITNNTGNISLYTAGSLAANKTASVNIDPANSIQLTINDNIAGTGATIDMYNLGDLSLGATGVLNQTADSANMSITNTLTMSALETVISGGGIRFNQSRINVNPILATDYAITFTGALPLTRALPLITDDNLGQKFLITYTGTSILTLGAFSGQFIYANGTGTNTKAITSNTTYTLTAIQSTTTDYGWSMVGAGATPAITVQAVGAAIALTPAMDRATYILTGAAAAAQNFTTVGLSGTAAGWCVYVRNGNNTAVNLAVTINGAGSQVLRGTSASSNSGFILLYWNGTALTQYI